MRSVSATRASGASAGWQQVKISRNRSIPPPPRSRPRAPVSRGVEVRSAETLERLELGALGLQRALAAQAVDRLVAGDPRDPRARVVRDAVAGPALERDDERLLDRLLGRVEVAEDADQGSDRPSRLVPEQAVDDDLIAYELASAAAGSSAPKAS